MIIQPQADGPNSKHVNVRFYIYFHLTCTTIVIFSSAILLHRCMILEKEPII